MTAIVPGVVFKPLPAGGLVYNSCEKLAFVGRSKKIGDESRKGRIFRYFDFLFFFLFYKRNVKSRIAMYVFTLSILDIHEGKCGGYINARLAELTCSPIRLS